MSVELRRVGDESPVPSEGDENAHTIQSLPPTDNGPEAWKFLFGAFMIEAFLWGFPMAFGVFQEYYAKQPQFADDPNIAVIGTVSTSIYFLGAPFAAPLVKKYQRWQKHMTRVGSVICVLSILGASFTTSVHGLIATQGVLYGSGFLLVYFPITCMLNEWFVKRRGFAYGVLYAGGGVSGVGLPFLLEWLLATYGYHTTLKVVAAMQFVTVAPVLPLVKGRLPASSHSEVRIMDTSFLRRPLFWCFTFSNLMQGFAFYIPSLYLPTFANAIGLSGRVGALILAANNIALVIGQVGFGYLSDRVHNILLLVFITTFVSAIASFTIWGFAHSFEALLAFAIVYGWFAGAYVVFWAKFGTLCSDDDPQPVYSLMAFTKGVGNIVTGPISAALLAGPITSGYGMGKYKPLILYLGAMMLCSSLGIFGWRLKGRGLRN